MSKKVIIAISAFTGSNTPYLLGLVEFMLFYKGFPASKYSLTSCTIDCILDRIARNDNKVHIIDGLSSVEQIDAIEQKLKILGDQNSENYVFRARGIEVPPADCLLFLQRQGLVDSTVTYADWRTKNEEDPYRKSVQECHKRIGTVNDYVYLCQEFTTNTQMGTLADEIILLLA